MFFNHSEIILLPLMADGKGKTTHMVLFGFKVFDTVVVNSHMHPRKCGIECTSI